MANETASAVMIGVQPPAQAPLIKGRAFFLNYPRKPQAVYTASNLPPGLTMDPRYGFIFGTPLQAGVWKAGITVANPVESITRELSFSVESSEYATWRGAYWPTAEESSVPYSDPDGDGRSNLLEYALGTNPTLADPPLPVIPATRHNEQWSLTLDVPENRVSSVNWKAQFSTDLTFNPAVETTFTMEAGTVPGWVRLRFMDPAAPASPERRFGRLKAVLP